MIQEGQLFCNESYYDNYKGGPMFKELYLISNSYNCGAASNICGLSKYMEHFKFLVLIV